MQRPTALSILAVSVAIGLLVTFSAVMNQFGAVAQENATTHPIVGAWLLTVDVYDETDPPALAVYHADHTYTDSAVGRAGGVGVWEPIDENTVATNVVFHSVDEDGNPVLTRIRTETTVDESGDAYTSNYTREVITPDGTSSGQLGPGTVTAERLTVETRGEPAGPMAGAESTPTS